LQTFPNSLEVCDETNLPRALRELPELGALIQAGLRESEGQGQRRQVEPKLTRDESGATTLVISVWGAPIAGDRRGAACPCSRTGERGDHRAHRFLPGDPMAHEQLRRAIREELRKDGVPDDAAIDIEAGPAGPGTHRVRVEVRQKQTTR
jgi:hypothetical protein